MAAFASGTEMEHLEFQDSFSLSHQPPLLEPFALKPWQQLGVTFLNHCRDEFGFAMLCDDMGIGKVFFWFTMFTSLDHPNVVIYLGKQQQGPWRST